MRRRPPAGCWWSMRPGASGGVSEAVVTALVDGGFRGSIRRVTSADSFIPLGDAARTVLLDQDTVMTAARELLG